MTKKDKINLNLISVIMNCHNGEKYLAIAIESVINQSHKNWEIIFWDNRSKDSSLKIAKKFKDKRIKCFSAKKFTNLHKARNLAIKKARGSFISFLDVDDIWEKNKLSLQLNKFKNKKINFVYGNCWLLNNSYVFKKKIFSKKILPTGSITEQLLRKYSISLPTIMVRKIALSKLKYCFDEKYKIIGDFDFSIRLSLVNRFECVQEPIAYNRIHENSFSAKNRKVEIDELSHWYKMAKNNRYGEKISASSNLKNVIIKIKLLKNLYLYNKNKSISEQIKFLFDNFNLNNVKIFLKILLPKIIIKKLTIYGN